MSLICTSNASASASANRTSSSQTKHNAYAVSILALNRGICVARDLERGVSQLGKLGTKRKLRAGLEYSGIVGLAQG
jgi:sulfur relay (sulfurtransferase) complex TusBCD TusD component (DsrE family)